MSRNNYMGKIDEDWSGTTTPNYNTPEEHIDNIKEIQEKYKSELKNQKSELVNQIWRCKYSEISVNELVDYVQQEITKAYNQGRKYLIAEMPDTHFLITKALEEQKKEIIKFAEKIIQEERFSGTPYAINKLINFLNK